MARERSSRATLVCYNKTIMHRRILLIVGVVLYYALATYALSAFDAGLLVTAVFLYGVPAWLLARFTVAPLAVILSVAALGAGVALLLEGVGELYGLWYTFGAPSIRLFNLVPGEVVIATILQTLFFVLLYEVLFDDGIYTTRSARERIGFFLTFAAATLCLVALHAFLLQATLMVYSYLWIIGSIVAATFVMLLLHTRASINFFDRVIDFTALAALPSALGLWLGVVNVQKIYHHLGGYIDTVNLFGATVPVEEVLLLFVIPFFVGTVYELYLDDRS